MSELVEVMRKRAKARRRAAFDAREGRLFIGRDRFSRRLSAVLCASPADAARVANKHTDGGATPRPFVIY